MKHFTIYLLLTLILGLGLMGCRKETIVQPKDYPYVITKDATNIDPSGVTLEANILYFGKDKITDFGFRLNDSYQYSLQNKGSLEDFKIRISTDIVNGITYSCRAYIRTTKNLVLGNAVSFVGLGSELTVINDVNPKEGFDGTLVTLTGKYFSQSGNAKVYINKVLAKVIYSSEDTIIFISPETNFVGDARITIKTADLSNMNSTFKILGPEIESFSPLSGYSGDIITIKGVNFIHYAKSISVLFGPNYAPVVSSSDTLIKVRVPNHNSAQSVFIKVINGSKTVIFNKSPFLLLY